MTTTPAERRERYKAAMQTVRMLRDGKNQDRQADAVMAVADREQQQLIQDADHLIAEKNREIARLRAQAAEVRAASLTEAVTKLRAIPVDCTALTGPVWYGAGWDDAIKELALLALDAADDTESAAARPDDTTGA